jgi:hypothetical protein
MNIESRVQRLEDIEAIRQLKALYCSCVDVGWKGESPDRKAKLIDDVFAADIVFEVLTAEGFSDRFVGRDEVRERYDSAIAPFPFGVHYTMNPIIEVDGDTAKGRWPVLVPLIDPDGNAKWFSGKYIEEYTREAAGWRISYLRQDVAFYTPFSQAWEAGVMR